ncbi:MAG: hypothetical protein PF447_11255 [Spirochaetaceae bacterium]|jgi:hypothetical protein|nr:hypothetical protein [Spirochaetaceae bacterium]
MKKKSIVLVLLISFALLMVSCVSGGEEVDQSGHIKVTFKAINIPNEGITTIGTEAIMAGYYLRDSRGREYNWKINANGDVTSPDLKSTIVDAGDGTGVLEITFYYDPGNANTDFKVFQSGSWDDCIIAPAWHSPDFNFKVDLSYTAMAGDSVEIIYDMAADEINAEKL